MIQTKSLLSLSVSESLQHQQGIIDGQFQVYPNFAHHLSSGERNAIISHSSIIAKTIIISKLPTYCSFSCFSILTLRFFLLLRTALVCSRLRQNTSSITTGTLHFVVERTHINTQDEIDFVERWYNMYDRKISLRRSINNK